MKTNSIYISKYIIAKKLSLLAIFLLFITKSNAQLVTTGGMNAAGFVENVLLGGGVIVTNVSFVGSNNAIARFDGSNSNIGLSYGIVITTGTAFGNQAGPVGPNNLQDAGIDNGLPGTTLLEEGGAKSHDASVLKFDFIPQGDSISFRYVFGSEEYKEYVGTIFNDAFGFFITGPNPNNPGQPYNNTNIAVLPDGTTRVKINNVSHLTNPQFYVDNELPFPGQSVQYDGFTRILTAKAKVVRCQKYSITIAIADISDGYYDSGVFLEGGSFSSNGSDISHTIINPNFQTDTLFNKCGVGKVKISRSGDLSEPRTLELVISGSASMGNDYSPIPNQVTFPSGVSEVFIDVNPIDNINFGTRSIIITVVDPNACPNLPQPSDTIWYKSVPDLTVQAFPDTVLNCNNSVIDLYAISQGGVGEIVYAWDNNVGVGNPISILARSTTTFKVTAMDKCGNTAEDQVTIVVPNVDPLTLTLTADTGVCPGTPIQIDAVASGGIGNLTFSWSTGDDSNLRSILVYPEETTVYSVIVSDSCSNTLTASMTASVRAPSADFTWEYYENRKLHFTPTVSDDVISYYWDFGDRDTSTSIDPYHTYLDTGYFNVTLIVTNKYGCTDTVVYAVYAYPDFVFWIPNSFTPNQNGLNDVFTGKGEGFVLFNMEVFNRWGEKIYESNDIHRGWNGFHKNQESPIGTYVYKMEVKTPVGKIHNYVGHINLIR